MPYFASRDIAVAIVTDMDVFPYQRHFRGEYDNSNPVIFDRESGVRLVDNNGYIPRFVSVKEEAPSLCFESGCSTHFPCYPEYQRKYADSNALAVTLNNACSTYHP
ncbi:MAG: hypothetical protein JKX76_01045 [Colwellia sp.]|nr:hypothetical protein [Colwellia sp.]